MSIDMFPDWVIRQMIEEKEGEQLTDHIQEELKILLDLKDHQLVALRAHKKEALSRLMVAIDQLVEEKVDEKLKQWERKMTLRRRIRPKGASFS